MSNTKTAKNANTTSIFHTWCDFMLVDGPTSPASADGVPAESKPFEDALRGCTLKYTHGTMKIWWVRFLMFLQVSSCRISGSFLSLPLITDMWHNKAWKKPEKTSAWWWPCFASETSCLIYFSESYAKGGYFFNDPIFDIIYRKQHANRFSDVSAFSEFIL